MPMYTRALLGVFLDRWFFLLADVHGVLDILVHRGALGASKMPCLFFSQWLGVTV